MEQNLKGSFYYGWVIVMVATLALLISNGLAIGGITIFYKPVQQNLTSLGTLAPGSEQSLYGTAPALTILLAGCLAPFAGILLARIGARSMMITGCFILGAGLVVYSLAGSPLLVYAAHSLLGASLAFVGVVVCTVLVSDWFGRRRGTALGFVLLGTSLGGVVIPQIAAPLIARSGWRWAMIALSLIVWLVLLPASVFLVRNHPAESDRASGAEMDAGAGSKTSLAGATLSEALAAPAFWVLSICAALLFYAIFVVIQQLVLYLQGPKIGFTLAEASVALSTLWFSSLTGKFLFGWLSDRFSARRVMIFSSLTMFAATLVLLHLKVDTVYLFAIPFGLTYGGTFVLLQLLVVEYFGRREYGKILGAVTLIETVGGALGPFITGRIADANGGDYSTAFGGVIIATAAAFLLIVLLNFMRAEGPRGSDPA
jgi:MFS family permease